MVHRGGLESSTEKNKKDDFNSCIAENAKTADADDISNNKIEESAPKAKQVKKTTKKASQKSLTLPLSDHSISQTVVRLERSRLIKTKNNPCSKAADTSSGTKSKRLSPVRAGLRSSSLESHTSSTSNNNNAKAKKKKVNTKKGKATDPVESPSKKPLEFDSSKNAQQPKLSKQLPLSLLCSVPLNRLSGILEKIKNDKTKWLSNAEEDTSCEDKSNVDKISSQSKTLCLYCDKRMSTVKVRARHIERFHTISKERRSSSRNPVTPSSQDSKDLTGTSPACSSSSAPSTPMSSTNSLYVNGCSYCSKSPKLQAVALENDLSALFFHLVDFHSDKYFGCKLCAIRFQTAAKLSDHVQRTHSYSEKSSNPVVEDVKPPMASTDEEMGKSTPTKTRRQMKQIGTESLLATTAQVAASSSSTINRNGSIFSNDEPILSRLGLTQNRLPRGRKGIRSRRQTNVDSAKPDTSLIAVKTRSKLGRFNTSNEPVETVFRTPTNTRIEPLSCTFDEDFYEKVFNNVRTNLSCHLDGKIGSDTESNRPQSPPPLLPAIRSTVVKSAQVLESEVHTATSLAALTAFPTLLTAEQYGCDFGTAKIKRPITRHSWKWKWDSVKKYKYVNEGGKIVKKIKQPMLGLRDLSKLDMWTQLTMRQKHEVVRKQSEAMNSQCLVDYSDNSREEKQRQVDQLNTILDNRRLPQIILEQNEQTIIKLEITDEGFRYLAGEISSSKSPTNDGPSTSQAIDRIIPANLNLIPSRSLGESLRHSVVLSGEWARPRCYVCFGCGARFDKRKALEEHKMFRHPHVYSTHYEIVGRELIEGNLYKHFFIPLKALSRHKEYAQRILVNKKTDYSVSKSSSNSGNEDESLDSLHSVTASFTTLSSSKLSDDCDTDTKTAIENVSSFAEPLSPHLTKNDTNSSSSAAGSSSSVDCTKCNRNCHGMLELYRHMLDCSGDYAWILAKKKKYRYYGSRKRRQFNRQNISALHLHRRKVKSSKDENESDETPKKKHMSPSTPRPRASDADSIRKMLENLPPKRVCREIIPNATKPRSRKFKTTAVGRKIQQNSTNNCKTSNTTLTAISKKILRNHKLRAISEKDKISRNKKILETKRKSARVKSRVIANKNVHSQNNKANKKTETGRGAGIVRKIGATTKRFVKKIKKRLLGEKPDDSTANKNDKTKPTEDEKKSSKVSAVRKLTFDKEHEIGNTQENSSHDDKTTVTVSSTTEQEEKDKLGSKIEKTNSSLSEVKVLIPTITIEANVEPKKLQDTSLNEDLSLSLRSEGSTENLHEQQSDLSASTEDLNKLNPGFLHNQVSPTTKRRSKKINDCIAMLTGKIQEKLGKPFLECKETQGADKTKNQNNMEPKIVVAIPEIKETKPTKRKALTRKIIKCDQSSEVNKDVQKVSIEEPKLALQIASTIKQTPSKRSSPKRSQLEMEQHLKESLRIEPHLPSGTLLKEPSSDKSTLKVSKVLPEKPALPRETLPKVSVSQKPLLFKQTTPEVTSLFRDPKLKEVVLMKPPIKDAKFNETFLMESLLKESPVKNVSKDLQLKNLLKEPLLMDTPTKETSLHQFQPVFENLPTNSGHSLNASPRKKELPASRKTALAGFPSSSTVFGSKQLSTPFNTDLRQPQEVQPPPPYTNFQPVSVSSSSKHPPPPVTIEIVTPAPVLLNEIVPKKLTKQPPLQQQCVINADTIRVPSIKPPQQLSIPQFMPVQQQQQQQIPTARGMITKRRQTIAGAPNDFLYDINSLRCGNAYNNLPFELEVPLDLSKKPKRTSPKAKQNAAAAAKVAPIPVHFPQISVKPNAVLMPPVPYQLRILPQTQIIPIMCESLLPNLPQIPVQSPPLVFSKEITSTTAKPTTSTPRKRATNNKKQDPIINIITPTLLNTSIDVPPPKKVSRKLITPVAIEKLISADLNHLPAENTNLIKEPILSLPIETNNKIILKEKALISESKITSSVEVTTNISKPTSAILEQPNTSSTQQTKTNLPSDEVVTPDQAPVITAKVSSEITNPEVENKISKVDPKETKKSKANKKPVQITTPKRTSPPEDSTMTGNQILKTVEPSGKSECKNGSSPESSQKMLPTRRSRRNKVTEQIIETKKPALPNNPIPPTSALKEVEEIAASFLSDDELENEAADLPTKNQPQQQCEERMLLETPPEPKEQPKTNNEVVDDKKSDTIPNKKSDMIPNKKSNPTTNVIAQIKEKLPELAEENEVVLSVTNNTEIEPTTNKQESSKKPRRRRKNELASIVADQLMESFKETDKSRIDDLKRLEELAYEKSEDLLLTGMRLMPTTKRKNVLDNKKDLIADAEPKVVNSVKESKKQKAESAKEKEKEKTSTVQQKEDSESKTKSELTKDKDNVEKVKDPKDVQKIELKLKNQTEPTSSGGNQPKLICKNDLKIKPLTIEFGNYRSNSVDSWSNRGSKQQNSEKVSPLNDKSPTSDTLPVVAQKDKKSKKKQMKKRDKKIEIENINQLRTGLESFTLSKDVLDNGNDIGPGLAVARVSENSHSMVGLFSTTTTTQQISSTGAPVVSKDVSPFGSFSNVKSSSSILRPSILAASLDIVASNKENPPQQSADRKSNISSRDPRLNKNIHPEEGEQGSVPPETTSRLATLRTRRKSFADATPPTYTTRANSRSTPNKRGSAGSRRNSLAFDDDEDDNYLTAIAKRVNDKIMSAEDKDFNLANDGFELASSFLDQDDPFGRPSTSMSVRSAPNFNDDRSNMDTMDATNTDLIDMDVDDDMSVYTTFSQDTTRSKGGRRRRRRRSFLLTRKPKKTNVHMLDSMETFDCLLCNKKFAKAIALNKHQLTIAHVSKVSEQEYLNATRKQEEEKAKEEEQRKPSKEITSAAAPAKSTTTTPSTTTTTAVAISPKQYFNAIQSIRLEENNTAPIKLTETQEKTILAEKAHKPHQPKVPFIPPNSILNQSGIEPISSPEQNYERYSTKTSSRLTLNPDERLFYECCNILKGSETPLVERTYPIVPPTTYAYDLQVKPVTPKSPNERFSYMKQSTSETNGKREAGSYPRLDVNQFSDISSDSNPACAQPPPVLPVNYAQMHVLSGAKAQAFLTNDGAGGGSQRTHLPRESSILQMASIASPNLMTPAPLTARTFVNQPSQIGIHHHGMESSAVGGQKQNFISPLHSASSQSSTITTTTCRLKTKAAMKGYDNLKVSIPTIGLDMEHALERSPRPGCKLTTLADIALGHETPHTTFAPSSLQMHNDQKSKCKHKPLTQNDVPHSHFNSILQSQPKENQVSLSNKKRDNSPRVKECSLVISVHDTESCMPIVLCSPKKPESIIPKDIYEFDDSENTPISKAIQSPFKIAEDNEAAPKKAIIIPERPFKNIGMEEKETIIFQKPETPAINDENTTSTVTYSDRDDFVYGSMSGGDDDNENDNDDNKETHVESDESSNSSAFTAKTFENKSLIMGRIFKNANKTKPKLPVEKPVLPIPEPPKQIPKQELDRLFDTLRGVNEKNANEERPENATASRKRETQSAKRKATASAKAAKVKATTTTSKRATKKNEQQTSKEMSQLHPELGMSPAEIAELIGEGQRKSQRRCAVNRPKKLVEIWSSDEFEEFLSTKDIIALIEEKEQKTKKRKKIISKKTNPTPATSKNNKKYVDDQSVSQSEDEKSESAPASPQKNNTPETSKAAKVTNTTKNTKTPKGKKKGSVAAATAAATAPAPKVTARSQKETKATSSGRNSIEPTKNNSSPFKKPTQKNIISKIAADDSESDFETELNRKTKTAGPIRNRRKTISGKLENDAGSSSSSSCAKKVSGKLKTDKSDARNSSKEKSKTKQPPPADSSQNRPQARRKRIASEMLYYWSSSSDEEFGRIESPHDDEHHIDESENYQQHGWIVGDSHKKLVTLLAIAKGNKKVDDCGVKESSSKKKS